MTVQHCKRSNRDRGWDWHTLEFRMNQFNWIEFYYWKQNSILENEFCYMETTWEGYLLNDMWNFVFLSSEPMLYKRCKLFSCEWTLSDTMTSHSMIHIYGTQIFTRLFLHFETVRLAVDDRISFITRIHNVL